MQCIIRITYAITEARFDLLGFITEIDFALD